MEFDLCHIFRDSNKYGNDYYVGQQKHIRLIMKMTIKKK